MRFIKRGLGAMLGMVLMVASMPMAFAKDFTVQLPVTESTAIPSLKDDFYLYTDGAWIKSAKIPKDDMSISDFTLVSERTRQQLLGITKEAVENRSRYSAHSDEARIADLYACFMDQKGREAAGLDALAEPLKRIDSAKSIQEYANTMASIARNYFMDGGSLGSFEVINDPIDNDKYVVVFGEPSAGLGKESMLDAGNSQNQKYYKEHIRDILLLYGRSPAVAEKEAADVFALEMDMAKHSLSLGEESNLSKSIHCLDFAAVQKLYSNLDAAAMLKAGGIGPDNGIHRWYVGDLDEITRFNELCKPELLPTLKAQAIFNILSGNSMALPQQYDKESWDYVQHTNGLQAAMSAEKRIEMLNESVLSQSYGRVYAARYVDPQRKKAFRAYLDIVMAKHRKNLENLDWMSAETKRQAIYKLDHMAIHIGMPDAWPAYIDQYVVKRPEDGGSLMGNIMALRRLTADYKYSLIGQPVRRDTWEDGTTSEVNAFYNVMNNSINFPIPILQEPFFDPKADFETNLGGIGVPLAHEITHCFDSLGAQYDAQGRLRNWWTDRDYAEFKKRQEKVVAYYERYVLPDGRRTNGEQTLGENIADLGAVSCLTEIVGHDPEKLRKMYTKYASVWRSKLNDIALRQSIDDDIHALDYVRVDAVLSATDGFYEAFGIQPKDGMYVPPEERVKIW